MVTMAGEKQIKRPDSLSKIAEDYIRQNIVRGQFRLGESLQEAKLSAAMGISKTPIREALAALKLQGLVQILPQRGAFVFTLSRENVEQLCRFRLILEEAAVDRAYAENPATLLADLQAIVSKMTEARESDAFERYLELDADFHDVFFRYCGNTNLKDRYRKVSDKVRTMRTHLSKRPERTDKSFEEHKEITRHLNEGNVKAAKTVLKRQITRGERSYSDLTSSDNLPDEQR